MSQQFKVFHSTLPMLESLNERSHLETFEALQGSLWIEIMSKKFLLMLNGIWENDEEHDKSKWENMFAPLAYENFGSRLLVTTQNGLNYKMIAKVIRGPRG
ncbi:hypothetical protein IEQ34_009203 [Dendrobium chrysotoxum]|uniref:NB-ARC domain-containing protein n=1 Tax=Dendrobium chrysotoxum TaxID=161865 RepID=A0AAV7H167_DENCH|nr:hypothetical protein IEQ34_009203 [Dendrobium chrysotoxum]